MDKRQVKRGRKVKLVILFCALAVVAATGYLIYHVRQSHTSLRQNGYTTSTTKSGTKSTTNPGGSAAQGGAIDEKGLAGTTGQTRTSPSISQSGAITVTQPGQNGTITSGGTIAGSSTLSSVQFRLIDDQTGVVAQGTLSVVNGKFAGKLNFRHQSSSGRLDIYSYNASGAEANELQIPVKFQ